MKNLNTIYIRSLDIFNSVKPPSCGPQDGSWFNPLIHLNSGLIQIPEKIVYDIHKCNAVEIHERQLVWGTEYHFELTTTKPIADLTVVIINTDKPIFDTEIFTLLFIENGAKKTPYAPVFYKVMALETKMAYSLKEYAKFSYFDLQLITDNMYRLTKFPFNGDRIDIVYIPKVVLGNDSINYKFADLQKFFQDGVKEKLWNPSESQKYFRLNKI
jgi:hypothetical protein